MGRVLLEGVEKVYEGGVKAVSDFNLEVADGEFLVLVGPSGCGKSTTLRMIAGLEEVSAGTVTIGDRVVNGVHPKDRDIAMVFQDYALYPHMTVYQNMAFGLKLRKFRKPEIDRRVREAAEILGITDLLERRPKALSGGQRQRVAVGRTIVRKPAVFLFDEPLSNLDAKLRVQMRVEISQLHSQLGVTMIYVTHDQTEAMTMGDRIVVMKDGLIQQVADPMTLYDCPVNDFVAGFIGTPPINFFPGRIPAGGELVFEVAGGFALRLPEARRRGLEPHRDRPLRIGIRPEDIGSPAATAVPGAPRIAAAVRVVEPMGADTYVHLDAGGHRFVSRVDAHQRFRPGQAVSLPVFIDKAHFFDAGTHRRLTA